MLDANRPIIALVSRQLDFFALGCWRLVTYIASMFLSRRLCASNYVYFASLDDVRTQNELAFLRWALILRAGSAGRSSPQTHHFKRQAWTEFLIDRNQAAVEVSARRTARNTLLMATWSQSTR